MLHFAISGPSCIDGGRLVYDLHEKLWPIAFAINTKISMKSKTKHKKLSSVKGVGSVQ